MIEKFVRTWEERKHELRKQLSQRHPSNYKELVTSVVRLFDDDEYGCPDPSKIVEVNHGGYQGTLVYLIPEKTYQPHEYWYVRVYYGSCSGCDTLKAIRSYSDELPAKSQVDQYMTIALHIVQNLRQMGGLGTTD